MDLIKKLDKIVGEKGLKIWDERNYPDLKKEIIITSFSRPIMAIYNYERDSFDNITLRIGEEQYIEQNALNFPIKINNDSKYIILGKSEILYYNEYIIGSNYQIIKSKENIDIFLNELFSKIDYKIEYMSVELEKWKNCWQKLYEIFTENSVQQNIDTWFKIELFNLGFNNNFTSPQKLKCLIKNLYNYNDYYTLEINTDPIVFKISYKNDLNKIVDYFIHYSRDGEYNKYQNSPEHLLYLLNNEIKDYRVVEGFNFY